MPKVHDVAPTSEDFALARTALLDITTEDTIGEPAGSITEADGTLTVYFDTTLSGYPGWKWTVSLAHVAGFAPSVLETELTPGEGALLSPDWVPWSERLADYKEAQALLAAEGLADDDSDDDSDDDDDDDFDDEDVNDDDEALLHSGDLDGVDIDSLDEADVAVESAPLAVGDDKAKKTKGKPDDAGPQPAGKSRSNQRTKKQKQDDKAD
jgi:hypothetical protein